MWRIKNNVRAACGGRAGVHRNQDLLRACRGAGELFGSWVGALCHVSLQKEKGPRCGGPGAVGLASKGETNELLVGEP